MMPDQPSRVSPAEISEFLDHARRLRPDAPLSERLVYFERKASILSRIAADLNTPEAHNVAADAWHYVGKLAREADAAEVPES